MENKQNGEYVVGNAVCTICNYHWIAVVPVNVRQLECPKCQKNSGKIINNVRKTYTKADSIKIGGYEFPTSCPKNCPGLKERDFCQGGLCYRCPIFNCVPVKCKEGYYMNLLDPEDYRRDWAEQWKKWFDNGMSGIPSLKL